MSRRGFVKWLLGGIVLLFGGLWVWLQKLMEAGESGQASAPAATAASPTPTPEPSPTPKPVKEKGKLLLSTFLFSDMHISVSEDTMSKKLRMALDDVTALEAGQGKPEAIVFGGDLTDYGRASDYALLRRILNEYKLPPLYGNMGNHDYYDIYLNKDGGWSTETVPNGKTDEQARKRFREFFRTDKHYGDAWVNGVHLILVSQDLYVQEKADVGEGAWYTDEQLAWLKKTMEPHADGRPALVFIHQPLPPAGTDGATHRLIRAKEFRAILAPYPNVFVFSGHTHQDLSGGSHYTKETFHWFINASVGRTRGGTGNKAQGLSIQVYEGAVVIKGREFSEKAWIPQADWDIPLA
ncbi:metallophosphoesterase family protein [Gorillibacterium sp. sgz5001074]|uniref:metallophosphoesterase family protein n=1 Tax=Gorillibacterium sp. sgz5001074 TaxID=3446695 RepID=UPI003F66B57D